MPFRQKTALVSLAALLLMYGWYFIEVARLRAAGPLSPAAMLGLTVPTVLGVILIQIVGTVLIAAFSGEGQAPMDERERGFAAGAAVLAYWVLLSGALAAAAAALFGLSAIDVANLALLAVALAEIVRYGGYALLHRWALR